MPHHCRHPCWWSVVGGWCTGSHRWCVATHLPLRCTHRCQPASAPIKACCPACALGTAPAPATPPLCPPPSPSPSCLQVRRTLNVQSAKHSIVQMLAPAMRAVSKADDRVQVGQRGDTMGRLGVRCACAFACVLRTTACAGVFCCCCRAVVLLGQAGTRPRHHHHHHHPRDQHQFQMLHCVPACAAWHNLGLGNAAAIALVSLRFLRQRCWPHLHPYAPP